ncbi:MAG TPA: hypothetical protein VFF59_03870 [Anaerolineae bacterium]|nr:hypothetical protein [Anaerolineae bacterium]
MARKFASIVVTLISAATTLIVISLAVSSPQLDRAVAAPTVTELHVCKIGCAYTTVQAAIDAAAARMSRQAARASTAVHSSAIRIAG